MLAELLLNTKHICFQNDILLSESSHYTFVYDDNECSLVVLNARLEDSGVYTCTARNLAGSVSCKAELTVHEGRRPVCLTEVSKPLDCTANVQIGGNQLILGLYCS